MNTWLMKRYDFFGMEHEHVKMLIIWKRDDLGDVLQMG